MSVKKPTPASPEPPVFFSESEEPQEELPVAASSATSERPISATIGGASARDSGIGSSSWLDDTTMAPTALFGEDILSGLDIPLPAQFALCMPNGCVYGTGTETLKDLCAAIDNYFDYELHGAYNGSLHTVMSFYDKEGIAVPGDVFTCCEPILALNDNAGHQVERLLREKGVNVQLEVHV